jgi:hypothetical protein
MAPFKDTHFLGMAGKPAALPSPAPAAAATPAPVTPQPQVPKGPVDFSAIIPGQYDRTALMSGEAARTPQPAAAPPAPPPPVGVSEHRDGAGVVPFSPIPPPLAADSQASGDGSIEDTTADLLRPMLRQWLADNMPRMVEKALHIEIAESVKKKP